MSELIEVPTEPLEIDAAIRDCLAPPRSFAQAYGRALFGPPFTIFVHEVAERAVADGVDALFFLSRDGFVFRRIYELLTAPGSPHRKLPARYLCLSRLPVLRALLEHGLTLKAVLSARNHLVDRARTVENTLVSLGLDAAMVAGLASRHGVDPAATFYDGTLHHPPLLNLLADPELDVESRRVGHAAAEQVRRYLRQEGMLGAGTAGLVDVGWGATIQDQLADAIAALSPRPRLIGYYFGANESLFHRRTPENWMEAVMASVYTPPGQLTLGNTAVFSFVGLVEEASRAPHGTCVGLAEEHGHVEPVLRDDGARAAEIAAEPELSRLQAGIIEYAGAYAQLLVERSFDAPTMRPLAMTALQRAVFSPEPAEIDFWQGVHHTNDIGGIFEIDEVLVTAPVPRWRRLIRWRRRSRDSMWTFGSVRYLIGRIGLLTYRLGWSRSKARRVLAPINHRQHAIPFSDGPIGRSQPTHGASQAAVELDESPVFEAAVTRADALAAADPGDNDAGSVPLVTDLMVLGTALVIGANRIVPDRWYAGYRVVNDGIAISELAERAPAIGRLARSRRRWRGGGGGSPTLSSTHRYGARGVARR
ncbi:hypothetical protein BH18ACT2_BH18ACT2_11890 [soil metagenome]